MPCLRTCWTAEAWDLRLNPSCIIHRYPCVGCRVAFSLAGLGVWTHSWHTWFPKVPVSWCRFLQDLDGAVWLAGGEFERKGTHFGAPKAHQWQWSTAAFSAGSIALETSILLERWICSCWILCIDKIVDNHKPEHRPLHKCRLVSFKKTPLIGWNLWVHKAISIGPCGLSILGDSGWLLAPCHNYVDLNRKIQYTYTHIGCLDTHNTKYYCCWTYSCARALPRLPLGSIRFREKGFKWWPQGFRRNWGQLPPVMWVKD